MNLQQYFEHYGYAAESKLAEALKLHPRTLYQFRTGFRHPSIDTMLAISEASGFKITVRDMIVFSQRIPNPRQINRYLVGRERAQA